VLREHFRWLSGREKLSAFESSPGKRRYFCSVCGSQLLAEREQQAHVIVRVATLDDDPRQGPQQHIWTGHDAAWLAYEDLPMHARWPPAR